MKIRMKTTVATLAATIGVVSITAVSAFADDGGHGRMQNNWFWSGNGYSNGYSYGIGQNGGEDNGEDSGFGYSGQNGFGSGVTNLPAPPTVTSSVYDTTGASVSLSAGWNLVDSTVARVAQSPATYFWNGRTYLKNANQPGDGVWVYESSATTVTLPTTRQIGFTVNVKAKSWAMVGNPFSTAETMTLQSGDVAYTYDPSSNQYSSAQSGSLSLQPGQGAWLYSTAGGTYSIGNTPPAPPSGS